MQKEDDGSLQTELQEREQSRITQGKMGPEVIRELIKGDFGFSTIDNLTEHFLFYTLHRNSV